MFVLRCYCTGMSCCASVYKATVMVTFEHLFFFAFVTETSSKKTECHLFFAEGVGTNLFFINPSGISN